MPLQIWTSGWSNNLLSVINGMGTPQMLMSLMLFWCCDLERETSCSLKCFQLEDINPSIILITDFITMSFLKRFFTCGYPQLPDRKTSIFPSFCLPKKQKASEHTSQGAQRSISSNIKMTSITTRLSSFMQSANSRTPPSTKILYLIGVKTSSAHDFEWGFIIGVVNWQSLPMRLLNKESLRVRVGKNQELSGLSSIRPRSLDCLVIYWSQLGCEFSIGQILLCQQRLVLVFQQWEILSTVIDRIDQQLMNNQGDLPLSGCYNKLQYSIIHLQSYFLVEFAHPEAFHQKLKEKISTLGELILSDQTYYKIICKITVSDYLNILNQAKNSANSNNCKQILHSILKEINQELQASKKQLQTAYRLSINDAESAVKSEKRKTISKESKGKSEDNEEQIQYFQNTTPRRRQETVELKRIDLRVDILNYDIEEEEQQSQNVEELSQASKKGFNLASPKRFRRKSLDNNYESYEFYDDQIYEKYS